MALVSRRDAAEIGAALANWTEPRLGTGAVRVVSAEHPSIGWTSETVLVDLAWSTGGAPELVHEFVVRLAPATPGTIRDYDLAQQTAAQVAAAGAGVPIATPELVTDLQWFGVPFVVMPRVRGHIIGEVAAFDPWLAGLTATQRSTVHANYLDAVAAIHRTDLAGTQGVPARDNGAELDFWAEYLDWSSGGVPVPALVDALAWCRAHRPRHEPAPALLWGDVRLGNVIFADDLSVLAVLDWDMTSIGAREHDVAWLTTLEATTAALVGRPVDGFRDRDATVAAYETITGYALTDFEWYETFAMLRSTAIMTRISYLHRDAGLRVPMAIDDNPLLDLLAARLT